MRCFFTNAAQFLKDRMWVPLPRNRNEKNPTYTDEIPPIPIDKLSSEESPCSVDENDSILTFRFVTCFMVLAAALGLTALDYSATGNIMARIGNDLNATTTQVEWIGNGYALSACVLQLPISALSDIFGRRNMLMVAFALIFIGSILCGTAQNMKAMIAGRVIQGAGGGGCYVLPEVIVADNIPLRKRSFFYGIFMIVWAVFSGSAPIIAGAFAERASWRWFFYLNLFISGTAFFAAPLAIRLKQQDDQKNTWLVKLKSIDYIGAILVVTSSLSILLALSRGGSTGNLPWSSWSIILPLVLGFAGIIITAFYENWSKPAIPMFNVRVFRNLSSSICYIHNVLQGIINLCSIYYLPAFFQGAKGYGIIKTGACILPLNLAGLPFVVLIGALIGKSGHYHIVNLLMWGLTTAGMGVMTLYDRKKNLTSLLFLQFMASIGINSLYASLSTTANATNPPSLWTESTSMMSFCRAFGDVFGTAIGGSVLASQMHTRLFDLTSKGFNVPETTNVLTLVDSMQHIDSPEIKHALADVLSASIRTVFIVLTVFSAFSFALTFLQKEYSLDQTAKSKQAIDG